MSPVPASLGTGRKIRCQSSIDEFTLWVSQRSEDLRAKNFQARYPYCAARLFHEEKKLKTSTILAKLSHFFYIFFVIYEILLSIKEAKLTQ
jgi:hypothetical protein